MANRREFIAAAGVVVGEVVPGIAAGAIVFPDSAPGPLGQIRAPVLPVSAAIGTVAQAAVLGGRILGHESDSPNAEVARSGRGGMTAVGFSRLGRRGTIPHRRHS